MRKSSEIRAALAEKSAEVKAIVEMATKEERELTDEEKTVIDRIQGIEDKPGEIQQLRTDLERAVRFEERVVEIANEIEPRLGKQAENKPKRKAISIPAKARIHGNLKAFAGENADRDAYVSGRWLAANFLGHSGSRKWLKDHGIQNSMSTDSNEKGGIFVPTEMQTSIIRLVEKHGVFRQHSKVTPMGSDRKVAPVRIAGMTAHPVAETKDSNEGSNTGPRSEPQYTNIELVARKWKAWVKMSDELNEDALISIADEVALEMALAFAHAEDTAGFLGDGSSLYHGITGLFNALNAGSIYTAIAGNTAFGSLDMADFETMVGKLPDFEGIEPAWFISKAGYFASMHRLLMAAGGNTATNLENGGRPIFLGYPVVFVKVLNKTLTTQANTKLLAFGDLRMASLFGDRRKMTMSLTDQRYWDEDQIAIKGTERFDINVHSRGTADEAGAILILQTPGS
jgi:HK97 family phage major capsid protein